MAIYWYCPEGKKFSDAPKADGYHTALGVEWDITQNETSATITPTLYRWDSVNTNDGAVYAYDFGKQKDSSIAFGAGQYTRKLKTLKAETFKKEHNKKSAILKYSWGRGFGTYYSGAFHQIGAGSANFSISIEPLESYSITYDLKGGKGNFPKQTKWHGENTAIHNRVPEKRGYKFLGWGVPERNLNYPYYTKPGGTVGYNGNMTLTAYYEKVSYNVLLDGNGGIVGGLDAKSVSVPYQETIPFPKAERANYRFIGWNTNKDGSGKFIDESYKVTGNITLYAIWEVAANCYIRQNGEYKASMLYVKIGDVYKNGIVYVKKDGVYKNATM